MEKYRGVLLSSGECKNCWKVGRSLGACQKVLSSAPSCQHFCRSQSEDGGALVDPVERSCFFCTGPRSDSLSPHSWAQRSVHHHLPLVASGQGMSLCPDLVQSD